MKIYIVGSVSSGKSTLAKILSERLRVPYKSLDDVVYISKTSKELGNSKREVEERDNLFCSLINICILNFNYLSNFKLLKLMNNHK